MTLQSSTAMILIIILAKDIHQFLVLWRDQLLMYSYTLKPQVNHLYLDKWKFWWSLCNCDCKNKPLSTSEKSRQNKCSNQRTRRAYCLPDRNVGRSTILRAQHWSYSSVFCLLFCLLLEHPYLSVFSNVSQLQLFIFCEYLCITDLILSLFEKPLVI